MVGGHSPAIRFSGHAGRIDMASGGKRKTTMAKRDRENKLRERRHDKQAKKAARKLASQARDTPPEMGAHGQAAAQGVPPALDDMAQHLPDV